MLLLFLFFFFFKQKTAYEMRISDWSSDVCSSDLHLVDRTRSHRLLPESSTNCAAPCHCTTACSSAIQDIPSIQRISVGRKAGNHGRRWMKKILLLAAAAGVLAVPGMAIAEHHGHGKDGPMTSAQLQQKLDEKFAEVANNKEATKP